VKIGCRVNAKLLDLSLLLLKVADKINIESKHASSQPRYK